MDNEVQRFFDSINFSSDAFIGTTVKKVIFNRASKVYNVVLTCPNIIDKQSVDALFLACKNKIKGKSDCFVTLEYEKMDEDILNVYLNELITSFYIDKPSLSKIHITYEDGVAKIITHFSIESNIIEYDLPKIKNLFKMYGLNIDVEIRLDDKEAQKIKEEIEKENEEPVVKVKENPMIMGAHVEGEPTKLIDITEEAKNIIFEVYIFGMETIERQGKKGAFYINNLKVSDKTDSYLMKIVKFDKDENDNIMGRLKVGSWIRVFGSIKMDDYLHSFIIESRSIEKIASKDVTISDNAEVKRVELHAHTMMSQMDGVTKVDLAKHTNELVTNAINMGYRGVAITDHNGCQGFPIAYQLIKAHNKNIEDPTKHFKGLYGTELTLVDDVVHIVKDPIDAPLKTSTFVVFDTETTGFNAASGDVMIEIGAVKIEDGVITDRFDEFINPGFHIPDNITALTEISDDMVSSADTEENVTKRFLEWTGDLPMVAHNAKFDISFIEMAMKKYNLGKFTNAVIDTLELSRSLDRGFARHSLSALVKRYNVPFDEESHHRADYDAEGTALVFNKMISKLENEKIYNVNELQNLVSKEELFKFGRTYHFNAIAKDRVGLKNLFKIISLANTTYLYKTPRIPRSVLNELREGLLIGSGCYESEVFIEARSKSSEDLVSIIGFYDYVEVQPKECYGHLIQTGDFKNDYELENHLKRLLMKLRKMERLL